LAFFVEDAVDALELQAFYARYEGDGRRRQPFEPAMLVKVLIYGLRGGVFSSRQIARRFGRGCGVPGYWRRGNFPAHRTIREFRQLHQTEFAALFVARWCSWRREAGW